MTICSERFDWWRVLVAVPVRTGATPAAPQSTPPIGWGRFFVRSTADHGGTREPLTRVADQPFFRYQGFEGGGFGRRSASSDSGTVSLA